DSVADVRGCARSQTIADVDEVSAGNNRQPMLPKLSLGHLLQPGRIQDRIIEMSIVQNCFECRDVTARSALSVEQEDGSNGFAGGGGFSRGALAVIAATPRCRNGKKQSSIEEARASLLERHAG